MPLTINKNEVPLVTDKTFSTTQNILSFHETRFDMYDDIVIFKYYVLALMAKSRDIYVYLCPDS